MPPIDSVLQLLVQQDGTELRLASERRPRMFKGDAELPLTMPATSTERIRFLLDDLWSNHAPQLDNGGRVTLTYEHAELGPFALDLACDGGVVVASFRRDAGAPPSTASLAASAAGTERPSDAGLPAALHTLLAHAAARGASDVHLGARGSVVLRVDGGLEPMPDARGIDVTMLATGPSQVAALAAGDSVDRALEVPGIGRIRVHLYASNDGLSAAIRLLRRHAPTVAELQLPAQLAPLAELPHGLIIACGPTGSGKSTTLAALAQEALQSRPRLLVTLEDPIEYVIRPGRGLVRQREVGTHVRDFASGLRDALREDPDLLLVGEMRDPETITLALTAAETGHLVLASLHSRTAASAIERIVDTYPPERQRQIRVQVADSLRAVIAQRLLVDASGGGRVPAVEVLRVTYAVANLIREGRTAQIVSAQQAGGPEGMLVLERHLAELVTAGRIRPETAAAAANDPAILAQYGSRTGG